MREITTHKVNGLNEALTINVLDAPGQGNACHEYEIQWQQSEGVARSNYIRFQKGPVKEAGVNGVSQEALLAIVIDRLQGFQSGQYSTRENAIALTHIETALMWLHKRTQDRLARGVEGTNIK